MAVMRFKPEFRQIVASAGGGFLEVYTSALGELPVLHVTGDCEEMGRQYGRLVGDKIEHNILRTTGLFTAAGLPEPLVHLLFDRAWERLQPYAPPHYLAEMSGIAEGAQSAGFQVTLADMQRLTTVTNLDMYKREERIIEILGPDAAPLVAQLRGQSPISCTMFAVWGSRTVDGKLFASRNLDWVSQTGMHEDRLLTVYHPSDGRHPTVTMGYAGVVGALAGMNTEGITFSEVGAFSIREELDGMPWVLIARHVLERAGDLETAMELVQHARHTIGYNYQVADGDPQGFGSAKFRPRAAVFETNFECCEAFREDDPKEHAAVWTRADGTAVKYGLPLREAVMRADMAFGKATRERQATDNGPGDPENDGDPFQAYTYLACHKPMHDMIRAYETGSEYIFPIRGTKVIDAGPPRKIGVDEALNIAATVAHNTEKLDENDWDVMSVVYAPTDLDFWVAYESCDANGQWKNAPDSGYWEFNLPELLEARP